MKKLITILTIMIVLVGSVFAINGDSSNGTAKIIVEATVSEQHPLFQLKANTATYTRDDFGVTNFVDVTSDVKAQNPTTDTAALTTDALLENGKTATVAFSIMQIARSSSTANYNLTVAATNLVRVLNPAGTEAGVADAADQKFVLADGYATPNITKGNVDGITYTGTGTPTLKIDYDGTTVGAAGDVEIATFSVVWNGNATALAGTYQGTVTLTVTAVN